MTTDAIIQSLTLEEKALLLQGKSSWTTWPIQRLNIPSMFLSDGPHGLRKQTGSEDQLGLNESLPATCFPPAATMANAWNVELEAELGKALGTEAAANDVHVLLGPGLNIKRSPLCGRNFEYFSEDPYLSGKLAAACIRGIQETGVAACPKHFAANSQELRRMSTDSVVDERTLREIYLTGFEIAVTEGNAQSIMSSYNLIGGTYANENTHLLRDILRQEWGFQGFVVTDWGASNDHAAGVAAGSNLLMPSPGFDAAIRLAESVRRGEIPELALDDRLRELLPVIFSTAEAVSRQPKAFDREAHHALARKCAAESVVLLENDGILPLAPDTRVALIGDFAETPRYQGSGSSKVNPTRLDSLKDALKTSSLTVAGYAPGYRQGTPEPDSNLIRQAAETAKNADAVLLCIGLDEISEAEGFDRTDLRLSRSHLDLLEAVRQANPNIILLLSGGAPFEMPDSGSFRAALHGYLGGQAGASAIPDILTGNINPSGKLAESWPEKLEDTPVYPYYPGTQKTAEYREGLFVGYRYYDTAGVKPRYPFGHGLSYTEFAYSDAAADSEQVSFTLTNTGSRDGAEVVQLYIACPNSRILRPAKELKGFAKVFLKAGESRRVTIPLDSKAFRYFNTVTNRWETESGDYEILVAASAADIRLKTTLRVTGTDAPIPGEIPGYRAEHIHSISDATFAQMLGRPIPDPNWTPELTRNDTLSQLDRAKSPFAWWIHRILSRRIETHPMELNLVFAFNMPFRGLANFSMGHLTQAMVDDLVFLFNGHFFRGLGRMIRDYLRSRVEIRKFRKELPK